MTRSQIVSVCAIAIVSSLIANTAFATNPRLTRISPYGGQLGTEIDVFFTGSNLDDAVELMPYDEGIEVVSFEVVPEKNGRSTKAKLKIAPDCRMGAHRFRVRTKTGISELQTFHVGALPVVDEKEPNSEFATPQAIPLNQTVHGRIDNEDVDYFVIEAKKGQRISVEIEAIRLGMTFFDPYIAILNEARFELASSDDNALVWQDSIASILAPEDGKYIVQVRDSAYRGSGASYYRLHVGHFPRPLGIVPAGGRPGEKVKVKFLGDIGGDFEQEVVIPTSPMDEFGVVAKDGQGVAPSWNQFRITNLENAIEQEPNEDREKATPMKAPGAANGYLSSAEDVDYFKFPMKKNQTYEIEVYARRIRSALDPILYIYDAKGRQLAANDDSRGQDSYVRFRAPEDDDYFIRVVDQLGKGGPAYTYRVEIAPIEPELVLTTNEFTRYIQPSIVIPKGRRFSVLVNSSRRNFGGPLAFTAENLPAGVTVESPATWQNDGLIPVMFHVTPEADLSGTYATILGRLNDPNQKDRHVEGRITQDHMLVRGQNNRSVWSENMSTVPVVVAEEVPFDVEIVTPKVPIVRSGTMNLKVVATRKEGFDGDISVLLLQNPPGVSSSRSAIIKKGQTETTITLNASGNAPLRESHIAVRALATVGNGRVEINSKFSPLRVADRYLNLKFHQAAVEQGQETSMIVDVENLTPFEGAAKVKLVGIPAKTTVNELDVTKETKQLTFSIKTEPDTPAGNHKSLMCYVTVMENGEPILHRIGTGRLRVDRPLPPKPNAKPAPKKEEVAEKPKETTKPLSRLEMLRKQQKEKLAAESGK